MHYAKHVARRLPPVVGLGFLVVVLELATGDGACYGSKDAVSTHLVAAKVTGCTAAHGTQQSTVAFSLCGRVRGAVLPWLTIGVLALRILVLRVGALLRELVRRLWTRILALWRVWLLLVVSGVA